MDNNGWTAAKVFRQPCSHDTCHSFNTSLSSSSAKWRTQWSRKRKNSFVGRLHFSEDHSMFVKLWFFFFFQNSFIKCPHLKCLIVPYCCVDYELHFFVNFCKMKKSKMSLSNTILTGKNHASHLPLLLKTWLPVAGSSVHIFTDSKPSKDLQHEISSIGAHIVNTGCRPDHSVQGLSCKMQEELTSFLHSSSKETRCWAEAPCWRGQFCPNVSTELASPTGAPAQQHV